MNFSDEIVSGNVSAEMNGVDSNCASDAGDTTTPDHIDEFIPDNEPGNTDVPESVFSKLNGDDSDCTTNAGDEAKLDHVDEAISEIACHGKGARWLVPTAQTIIDIGGQDCKAMKLDADGNMIKFTANDKCASGTGRFLEIMAMRCCPEKPIMTRSMGVRARTR